MAHLLGFRWRLPLALREAVSKPPVSESGLWSWPLGFIAIIAGWTTTEVGRQPWAATGIIRTAQATSPLFAGTVAATLILFCLVYLVIYSAGIYYMNI